jgi:hypothetical protein
MGRLLMIAAALATAGCSGRVEKDDRPTFHIDPAQPFRLELGRGSGWHGLDTIRLSQDGSAVLHRLKQGPKEDVWETATLRLEPGALAEVLKAVEANDLTGLHRAYHEPGVHDGTQWVLWIEQGGREKSVYFNNRLPRPIIRFAEQLDDILARSGVDRVTWQPVPPSESRRHERELWDSIKRQSRTPAAPDRGGLKVLTLPEQTGMQAYAQKRYGRLRRNYPDYGDSSLVFARLCSPLQSWPFRVSCPRDA